MNKIQVEEEEFIQLAYREAAEHLDMCAAEFKNDDCEGSAYRQVAKMIRRNAAARLKRMGLELVNRR